MSAQPTHPDELLLACRGLVVGHAGRAILPPIDFEVRTGQAWAVVGPNGSGKTTLLRTVLGLLPMIAGELQRPRRGIGYVPQRSAMDADVPARVIDLVRSGAERGWSFANPLWLFKVRPQVQRALAETATASLCSEPWQHLSEGQKQRVLMAQALAGDPQLLVLDEPTSAMDLHAELSVFQLLGELRRVRPLGVLMVGHNLALLARHATHALLVDKDQGAVVAGTVAEVVASPAWALRYGLPVNPPQSQLPRGGGADA